MASKMKTPIWLTWKLLLMVSSLAVNGRGWRENEMELVGQWWCDGDKG